MAAALIPLRQFTGIGYWPFAIPSFPIATFIRRIRALTRRIDPIHRIIPDIRIQIHLIVKPNGIGLEEPSGVGVEEAGLVVVEAGFGVELLAGEAEGEAGGRAADLAIGAVGVALDHIARRIRHRDDAALPVLMGPALAGGVGGQRAAGRDRIVDHQERLVDRTRKPQIAADERGVGAVIFGDLLIAVIIEAPRPARRRVEIPPRAVGVIDVLREEGVTGEPSHANLLPSTTLAVNLVHCHRNSVTVIPRISIRSFPFSLSYK